jgi:hypothetical protein
MANPDELLELELTLSDLALGLFAGGTVQETLQTHRRPGGAGGRRV